ncbi:MAG: inositol monophosphatase family protein [Micromonosporaceae bacterium]
MLDEPAAELIRFAEHLANESRDHLERAAEATGIAVKADKSFVTETDRAIEARLRELIAATYPHHGIWGEEYGGHHLDAEIVWVLDPIDGTAPFIAGIPVYGTLIGVSRFGAPWIGVADYPATDDRWVGLDGAFATRNGVAVRTRRCFDLGTALMTCSSPDFFRPEEHDIFATVRDAVQFTLYGASSFAYALLASGKTDLAVDGRLKSHDVFAPAAVIGGAGGVVTDWSGAELKLGAQTQIVAAGDAVLHREVLALLGHHRRSAA